jgi:hypothetical protein
MNTIDKLNTYIRDCFKNKDNIDITKLDNFIISITPNREKFCQYCNNICISVKDTNNGVSYTITMLSLDDINKLNIYMNNLPTNSEGVIVYDDHNDISMINGDILYKIIKDLIKLSKLNVKTKLNNKDI